MRKLTKRLKRLLVVDYKEINWGFMAILMIPVLLVTGALIYSFTIGAEDLMLPFAVAVYVGCGIIIWLSYD